MKNILLIILSIVAVIVMLAAGVDGLNKDYTYGPFVTFVGCCTGIGLVIDVYNHVQMWIRKSNVRKLGRF